MGEPLLGVWRRGSQRGSSPCISNIPPSPPFAPTNKRLLLALFRPSLNPTEDGVILSCKSISRKEGQGGEGLVVLIVLSLAWCSREKGLRRHCSGHLSKVQNYEAYRQ
ncbi:hypothetical protein TNCV_4385951 [Trichonephila clavipes]|nr:hypothetical protein TNCV_4385951 [Trichonephila clavipes]